MSGEFEDLAREVLLASVKRWLRAAYGKGSALTFSDTSYDTGVLMLTNTACIAVEVHAERLRVSASIGLTPQEEPAELSPMLCAWLLEANHASPMGAFSGLDFSTQRGVLFDVHLPVAAVSAATLRLAVERVLKVEREVGPLLAKLYGLRQFLQVPGQPDHHS